LAILPFGSDHGSKHECRQQTDQRVQKIVELESVDEAHHNSQWSQTQTSRVSRNVEAEPPASFSYYSSILRPISINALDGILNRSIACAELRAMNENNAINPQQFIQLRMQRECIPAIRPPNKQCQYPDGQRGDGFQSNVGLPKYRQSRAYRMTTANAAG